MDKNFSASLSRFQKIFYRGNCAALHTNMLTLGVLLFFSFLSAAPQAWCEDDPRGVLASGVVHNIASDRKVEKIGGVMQPEPLDFYIKRLFERLTVKLEEMDRRLENIESSLRQGAAAAVPLPVGQNKEKK